MKITEFPIYETIRKAKQSDGSSSSSSDDPREMKENTEMETKEVSYIKLVMFFSWQHQHVNQGNFEFMLRVTLFSECVTQQVNWPKRPCIDMKLTSVSPIIEFAFFFFRVAEKYFFPFDFS